MKCLPKEGHLQPRCHSKPGQVTVKWSVEKAFFQIYKSFFLLQTAEQDQELWTYDRQEGAYGKYIIALLKTT